MRVFQEKLYALAVDIAEERRRERTFVLDATPGGGKTRGCSIFAHELLDSGVVQKVLIVVPRDSLRSQTREGFTDNEYLFRGIVDDPKQIRRGQESMLERSGWVTTYQAIAAAPDRWLRLVRNFRLLLILDEGHHLSERPTDDPEVAEGAAWWRGVKPIADIATRILLASGTLWARRGQKIPLVPYREDGTIVADVTYSRREAMAEKAILPINFKRIDGRAMFAHRGHVRDVQLSTARKADNGKALKTLLLSQDYRDHLLGRLTEWQTYRRTTYPSRAIVITHSQKAARLVAEIVSKRIDTKVALAISDDAGSKRALKAFRSGGSAELLITVGMAHEGLDVRDATHLICMTDIRKKGWLEQAFGRVTRVDPACGLPWEQQCAYIYVPNDPLMQGIIADLLREQNMAFEEMARRAPHGAGAHPMATFKPISGSVGATSYSTVDGNFTADESALIDRALRTWPSLGVVPLREVLDIGLHANWDDFNGASVHTDPLPTVGA
jgi:superfamily II DNA or RNA helicase